GSVSEGSTCHTRLNSHGCWVPSYHWCVVSGFPVASDESYTKRLLFTGGHCGAPASSVFTPGWYHVFPPSSEAWNNCPNHPLVCETYTRSGFTGDPFMW